MWWSRNARHVRLGIPDGGLPTNEVSNTTSIRSEQDVRGDERTSGGSPSGTAKGHPIVDDPGAATVVGSSSGKSMARKNFLTLQPPPSVRVDSFSLLFALSSFGLFVLYPLSTHSPNILLLKTTNLREITEAH